MKAFIVFFIFLSFVGFAQATEKSACRNELKLPTTEKEFFDEQRLIAEVESPGSIPKFKFTEANRQKFKRERANLQRAWTELNSELFEASHAIWRFFEMKTLKTHGLISGDSGSGKTDLSQMLQFVPFTQPDGNGGLIRKTSVFAYQLNQLVGDALLRGYIDPDLLKVSPAEYAKDKDAPEKKVAEIKKGLKKYFDRKDISIEHAQIAGTLGEYKNAILDEIDKMNPLAGAAIFDILNEGIRQLGPITIPARTQNVIATSNMNIYEIAHSFKEQGMEFIVRPLLDRLPFKIYMHNYLVSKANRYKLLRQEYDESTNSGYEELANPEKRYEALNARMEQITSNLPEVDWEWLGTLATKTKAVQFTDDSIRLLEELIDDLRSAFYRIRRDSEATIEREIAEKGVSKTPIYYPPTIFSNRNNKKFQRKVVAVSVFLRLMRMPEEILSTDSLITLIEQNEIQVDRLSMWRSQDVSLTAVVGDPVLSVTNTGTDKKPVYAATLTYGEEIDLLNNDPFDRRESAFYNYTSQERAALKSSFETRVVEAQKGQSDIAEGLMKLLGPHAKKSVRGIEEFIQLLDPDPEPYKKQK